MRILLTGASGLLGNTLVQQLCARPDIELTVVRSSQTECVLPLGSSEIYLKDVSSSVVLEREIGTRPPTHIVHLAALSSPAECESDPNRAYIANVQFTKMLCSIAQRFNAHIVFTSTDLVFDGEEAPVGGFTEDTCPSPLSVYASTKRSAELMVLDSNVGTVVRLSLLYGRSLSVSKGMLGWLEGALREGHEITLFKDEFRTPIFLNDAARAIFNICEQKMAGLWHCGGPERISRVDFGRLVAQVSGLSAGSIREALREEVPLTPARPKDVSLDSNRLFSALGFSPLSAEEALKRIYGEGRPATVGFGRD